MQNGRINIGIVGCGSLGGVIGWRLLAAGEYTHSYRVWIINKNPEIGRAVSEEGLVLQTGRTAQSLNANLVDNPQQIPVPLDCVILTTKANALIHAAQSILPFLAEGAPLITTQNGLVGLELADDFDDGIVLPASVLWGATMYAPGKYRITVSGPFIIGERNGAVTDKLEFACNILKEIFPVSVTKNIEGVLWAKLAINTSLTALGAITGLNFGRLVSNIKIRELILAIGRECLHVSEKRGITLEPLGGGLRIDYLLKATGTHSLTRHLLIRALGFKHRKTDSSMLDSIRRGRKTEIDYLNGKIVDIGRELNVETPLNMKIVNTIKKMESGVLKPGIDNLALID